jgi:hypothetical protein
VVAVRLTAGRLWDWVGEMRCEMRIMGNFFVFPFVCLICTGRPGILAQGMRYSRMEAGASISLSQGVFSYISLYCIGE